MSDYDMYSTDFNIYDDESSSENLEGSSSTEDFSRSTLSDNSIIDDDAESVQLHSHALPQLTWNEDCPICLSALVKPCLTVRCYHKFCLECLVRWFQNSHTCPVCRNKCQSIIYNIRSSQIYCEVIFYI
uniref:RING-type E3 ubiquitin transferase n=1 Tax=Henneguya salminicola TaxID=69463 RepID=A0A6G3MIT5_HENSL